MTTPEWLGLGVIWCLVGTAVLRWRVRRSPTVNFHDFEWTAGECALAVVLVLLWPLLVVL